MQVSIHVDGLDRVRSLFGRILQAAAHANGPVIVLSSDRPYAYGIETGRHRSGRLARRAGGAFMFRDGIAAVRPRVPAALGKALLQGSAAVDAAKRQLNADAVAEVQRRTPVRTGRLRASVRASGRPG